MGNIRIVTISEDAIKEEGKINIEDKDLQLNLGKAVLDLMAVNIPMFRQKLKENKLSPITSHELKRGNSTYSNCIILAGEEHSYNETIYFFNKGILTRIDELDLDVIKEIKNKVDDLIKNRSL